MKHVKRMEANMNVILTFRLILVENSALFAYQSVIPVLVEYKYFCINELLQIYVNIAESVNPYRTFSDYLNRNSGKYVELTGTHNYYLINPNIIVLLYMSNNIGYLLYWKMTSNIIA